MLLLQYQLSLGLSTGLLTKTVSIYLSEWWLKMESHSLDEVSIGLMLNFLRALQKITQSTIMLHLCL